MSDLIPQLPRGYRARAATVDDVDAIHRLVAACERDLYGSVHSDAGSIAADFARAGLVPELDTLLVHDDAEHLTARAWVNRRSEADVHPDHRGRGLGGAILDWVVARARQAGDAQVAQTVADLDKDAVALIRSRGFEANVAEWSLEFVMTEEPELPEPPSGVTVRAFRPGDGPAVHELIEDAFAEWQLRRRSYQEWAASTVERPTFAPDLCMLAFAGDELIGAVLSLDLPDTEDGHIEQVAVRRDHRHKGVARLLLRHAFRAFYLRGRRTCTLATHSNTGALDLYLRVGMTVRHSSTVYKLRLQPPID